MSLSRREFRAVVPGMSNKDGECVRTILASYHMINAQNMIDAHFAKSGVFEIWKELE